MMTMDPPAIWLNLSAVSLSHWNPSHLAFGTFLIQFGFSCHLSAGTSCRAVLDPNKPCLFWIMVSSSGFRRPPDDLVSDILSSMFFGARCPQLLNLIAVPTKCRGQF